MKAKLLIYSLVGGCFLLFGIGQMSNRALAATILDQFYLPTVTQVAQAQAGNYQGQVFTIGVTGQLDQMNILMGREPSVAEDVQFYVFQVQGSAAQNFYQTIIPYQNISTVCCTVEAPSSYLNRMLAVDLTSLNIFVTAGQQWGFVVHSNIPFGTPQINLLYGCENGLQATCGAAPTFNGYLGGSKIDIFDFSTYYLENSVSAAFQTFVDPNAIAPVPLPPSIVSQLLGLGLLGLLAWRRKRKDTGA